ncbi:hypothetical protein [Tardiphaga sp.]|uniref:hypothetical protein n=1 Tax=Tardiphaga sp. TaxID=1926292 RepID=UPI0037DA67AA
MIQVPDIYEFIRSGELPESPESYTDATWYCVKLSSRHQMYGAQPCLCLYDALPKQVVDWKTPSMAKLASTIEQRADADRVPVVISLALGRLGPALADRGYRQHNPNLRPNAQQTWLRDVQKPEVPRKMGRWLCHVVRRLSAFGRRVLKRSFVK